MHDIIQIYCTLPDFQLHHYLKSNGVAWHLVGLEWHRFLTCQNNYSICDMIGSSTKAACCKGIYIAWFCQVKPLIYLASLRSFHLQPYILKGQFLLTGRIIPIMEFNPNIYSHILTAGISLRIWLSRIGEEECYCMNSWICFAHIKFNIDWCPENAR